MKTRIIVTIFVLVFLSVACGRATLPHTLDVPANRRWVKTKVYLEAGQSIHVAARGVIYLEGDRYESSPNGGGSCENAAWGSCSLVGVGWGTLLGRIGKSTPSVIGASSQVTATRAGYLQLGINDTNFDDNSGSYTVTITETEIKPTASSTSTPTATPTLSLRYLAETCGIWIGAAVAAEPLRSETLYAETLAREFNMLTPENVMKFGPLCPRQDHYDFDQADAIVAFAEGHDMQIRGHVLVWHQQLPSWLTEGNWTGDELMEILQEHIATVVGRYRGQIAAWDVVNEAVAGDGSLTDTIWLRGIGPEYIEMAFRWAHEADPDALLFYNDYGGEGLGRKSDAIYALVRDLLQRDVPIHGVGLQMHVGLDWSPKSQDVAANMERLSALGLEVHITEMDVRIEDPVTDEELAEQARVYGDMLQVCLAAQNCKAFVLWGFTDRHSWIPHFSPGWDAALIFDKSYDPKPAYNALMDGLADY